MNIQYWNFDRSLCTALTGSAGGEQNENELISLSNEIY